MIITYIIVYFFMHRDLTIGLGSTWILKVAYASFTLNDCDCDIAKMGATVLSGAIHTNRQQTSKEK